MKDLEKVSNPFNDDKVIANCSLFGMMSIEGKRFTGADIIKAIANMHDRGNGLGGGFAAFGIYPEYEDLYALQIMFNNRASKEEVESFIKEYFRVAHNEEVPNQKTDGVSSPPIVWRYFVEPKRIERGVHLSDDDYVVEKVMVINSQIKDSFVFSSGKNMGVFKGVGHAEDIGRFFCLHEYEGYLWTSHARFPTNTQGWWGGAHPFSILDWTVVHNGEISSYGINKRFLEMYGYHCTMHTDTEVVAYALDLLMRKHHLPIEIVAKVLAAPLWTEINRMSAKDRNLFSNLRQVYGSLLMNGPFTIIIARQGEMIGLGDRVRLRPLTAGVKDDMLYLSSEEAAIRLISPELDNVWIPKGGEPIVGRLGASEVIHERYLQSVA
ncbi:MAG: glutamine amidotransferase family protein [Thermodesulfobacteriota bacterium]